MPRSKLPRLSSINEGSFEPKKNNPISLRNDENLDSDLKIIKVGESTTPLSLSESELRIEGDLFLSGKLLSHRIETDNKYLHFIALSSDSGYAHFKFSSGDTEEGLNMSINSTASLTFNYTGTGIHFFSTAGNFLFWDSSEGYIGHIAFKMVKRAMQIYY